MQAVTIFARGPLAGTLGIDAGGAVVKVAGKITIAGALKRAGIDMECPEMQGCFLIVCNNKLVPAGGPAQTTYVEPGAVIELLPVAAGG
jgi:sulfur carrier protein ThiS